MEVPAIPVCVNVLQQDGWDAIASEPNKILQSPEEESLVPGTGPAGELWAAKEALDKQHHAAPDLSPEQPLSPAHSEHTCSSDHSTPEVFVRDMLCVWWCPAGKR